MNEQHQKHSRLTYWLLARFPRWLVALLMEANKWLFAILLVVLVLLVVWAGSIIVERLDFQVKGNVPLAIACGIPTVLLLGFALYISFRETYDKLPARKRKDKRE